MTEPQETIPLGDYNVSNPDALEAALSASEAALDAREAAAAAREQKVSLQSGIQAPDTDAAKDDENGDEDKTGNRPESKPEGDKLADDKPPAKPDGGENDKTEDAKLSPYEKEKQRQARAWNKINEEKEAIKRERMALEAERTKPSENPPSSRPYTADQLKAAIPRWEEQGKYDFVEMAKAELKELEKIGGGDADPARAAVQQRSVAFQTQQAQSWDKAKTNFPDLMSVGSPLNAEVRKFIASTPRVMDFEDGPLLAAEYIDAKLKSGRLPELTKQIDSLSSERVQLLAKIKDLEAQLSPGGGGDSVSGARGETSFNDLSVEEMGRKLRAELGG